MPNIVLSYSDNVPELPLDEIFPKVHQILHEVAGASLGSCKSRAIKLDQYYIGEGSTSEAIIFLQVAILPGRDEKVRAELGRRLSQEIVMEMIMPLLYEIDLHCEPTIEVLELATYYKLLKDGTLKQLV